MTRHPGLLAFRIGWDSCAMGRGTHLLLCGRSLHDGARVAAGWLHDVDERSNRQGRSHFGGKRGSEAL